MKRSLFVLAAAAVFAPVAAAQAQGISVTPSVGMYIPASDLYALRDGTTQATIDKEGTFALGLNVEFGMLRGTVAYASGAQINEGGVSGQENIGDGKLLAVAGDLVLRPIPRLIIIQPYLIAGAGFRQENYSYNDDGVSGAMPKDQRDFALHAGLGADIMLGRIGVVAEFSDFITKNEEDKWNQHDGFGFVGLKLRVF